MTADQPTTAVRVLHARNRWHAALVLLGDCVRHPLAGDRVVWWGDACPEHAVPLLDERKVKAYVTLLDWDGGTRVIHACVARLEITKERAHG